jgi:hypothetical protein
MTTLSTPALPGGAAAVRSEEFAVRFVTPDDRVHEIECRSGSLVDWRHRRTSLGPPTLELYIPRVFDGDDWDCLPFLDDPYLHRDVLVAAGERGSTLSRLFPLAIAGRRGPEELLADFGMLWILRDGPFGDFAWRNVFVNGQCEANDAVSCSETENTPWDIILEVDFTDCVDHFLGVLEIRDLIARGQVDGSIAAISALTWFVERDEMIERAQEYRAEAELLRDWTTIARSDATRTWVAQRRES